MDYHMHHYIYESPASLRATLTDNESQIKTILQAGAKKKIDKVVLSGLESSFTAAAIAHPIFQIHCQYPVLLINSEEMGYYQDRWVDAHTLIISVSRSGERAAVIDTLKNANERGALIVAVTGVADGLLAQSAAITLLTREGPEITLPKTKSVVTCTAMLMCLGLAFSHAHDQQAAQRLQTLQHLAEPMEKTIRALDPQISAALPAIKQHKLINVVGTCSNHGVALEAAIKIQEAALIPTRGDSTAGLLQGPVGGLNADWLVVLLVMKEDLELSKQLLALVRDFRARSLVVCPQGLELEGLADHHIAIPDFDDPYLAGLVFLSAIQLLAYYLTVVRSLNPDKPKATDSILMSILPPGRQEPN